MNDASDEFRIRIGRMRDLGGRRKARAGIFVVQVLQAASRAGHGGGAFGARGRGGGSRFGRGRGAAIAVSLRSPSRRVVVQVRVVRHAGRAYRAAPLAAHLAYLQRDGVDREGGAGRLFDAAGEGEAQAFAARCEGDRHHFRIMVSPEDAAQLRDLKGFARELMSQAEKDLGTRLEWTAAEHWNTAHPHLHILLRGRDDQGQDLVISRDYIARGLRARAEALVSLELGPRSAREIAADLQRQVGAERWTGLDRMLTALAREGRVDLRPGPGAPEPDLRPLLIARAEVLGARGLAAPEGSGLWRLHADAEPRLRELAMRGDIVRTLQRAFGRDRALAELSPHAEALPAPVVGRLVERGLFDEQTGSAYVLVDGLDGRAHHVRLPDLAAAGDTPVGGIVEVRPAPGGARLLHRSDLAIEEQVTAQGATWLDRQLVAREPAARAERGFGAEVGAALQVRAEHLESLGLARRAAAGWVFGAGLIAELRGRELAAAAERIACTSGLSYREDMEGPQVSGLYRRRIDLASGRFAMVEDGLGFRLAPWAAVLDRRLGQEVAGRLKDNGVDWEIGRTRGLSL